MTQRLNKQEVLKLREQFMGKRISFLDQKGERFIGQCEFMGYNIFLPSWEFQVTINRMPVSHVRPETIREEKPII